ncbi:helix-turn-helix transcriptional regulator [Dactylosporangium salmoneum]|uniref:Helix-turn-helix domain-containing protein n=1 Tax=Dactylosporangium salmoneum TaxID=53361 RepID=A0ABP5TWD6_9ACTN
MAPVDLARRLRELREKTWDGARTQGDVAKALGVSVPLISSWESRANPVRPPRARLATYALLFSTNRPPVDEKGRLRLPAEHALGDDERRRRRGLEDELVALGGPVEGPSGLDDPRWRFGPDEDVVVVCAPLPMELRAQMPYADPADPDYVALLEYADLDALLEIYGHLRAVNPRSRVQHVLSSGLRDEDTTAHLVVLGGVDWNDLTRDVLAAISQPVEPLPSDDPQGAGFRVGGATYRPVFGTDGGRRVLLEDVVHFYRGPNPFNRTRTVTICSGTHGQGTYAVVRALTDPRLRAGNAAYIESKFGDAEAFSILARARVRSGKAVAPDWTDDSMRLHEWFTPA